jgi:hypothetical protein
MPFSWPLPLDIGVRYAHRFEDDKPRFDVIVGGCRALSLQVLHFAARDILSLIFNLPERNRP